MISGSGSSRDAFLKMLLYLFIYFWLPRVFTAGHGLFSSRGGQGLLCVAVRAWLLLVQDTGSRHAGLVVELQRSRAWAQSLWHMCLIDPMHGESSLTRDQTHVPCIGR